MALIKGKTGKFLRGAAGTLAKVKLEEHKANIMAERDAKLAAIRAQSQQKQNVFTAQLQEDQQVHQVELAKMKAKTSGLPADVLTHQFLTEQAKSDDPILKAAAEHALGLKAKPSSVSQEKFVSGYVKLIADAQVEQGIEKGEEGYKTVPEIRQSVIEMLKPAKTDKTGKKKNASGLKKIVIKNHPDYGDITEEEILETMRVKNKTRNEVMSELISKMPMAATGTVER